jgi:hypothetical protein
MNEPDPSSQNIPPEPGKETAPVDTIKQNSEAPSNPAVFSVGVGIPVSPADSHAAKSEPAAATKPLAEEHHPVFLADSIPKKLLAAPRNYFRIGLMGLAVVLVIGGFGAALYIRNSSALQGDLNALVCGENQIPSRNKTGEKVCACDEGFFGNTEEIQSKPVLACFNCEQVNKKILDLKQKIDETVGSVVKGELENELGKLTKLASDHQCEAITKPDAQTSETPAAVKVPVGNKKVPRVKK